ncbi:MAG: nucleotidyltransferase domain-containing protein [Bacteroidia bacterium]|nr:nucleotidyltransferase domain-containing protein [Bacteroidia bacterium]
MNLLEQHRNQVFELCKQYKVRELYAFGSVLRDDFNSTSDIDLLIQFSNVDRMEYFDNYMDLKEAFEKLLGRPVDLVEIQAIRNPIFRKIVDRDKKLLYERNSA